MVLSSVCANKTTSSSWGAAAAAVDCVFCEEKEKNVDVAVDADCDCET